MAIASSMAERYHVNPMTEVVWIPVISKRRKFCRQPIAAVAFFKKEEERSKEKIPQLIKAKKKATK